MKVLSEGDSAAPKKQHVGMICYLIWLNHISSGQATEDGLQFIKDMLEKR